MLIDELITTMPDIPGGTKKFQIPPCLIDHRISLQTRQQWPTAANQPEQENKDATMI